MNSCEKLTKLKNCNVKKIGSSSNRLIKKFDSFKKSSVGSKRNSGTNIYYD